MVKNGDLRLKEESYHSWSKGGKTNKLELEKRKYLDVTRTVKEAGDEYGRERGMEEGEKEEGNRRKGKGKREREGIVL